MQISDVLAIATVVTGISVPLTVFLIKLVVNVVVAALEERENSVIATRLNTLEKSHDRFRQEITSDVKELEVLLRKLLAGPRRLHTDDDS